MTVLAKKQTEVINVASLNSGIKVPGCQDNDDGVVNDADIGNDCCLSYFWYNGHWLPYQ
jgi:hypothetical protein